jgi:hypothetical protein
LLKKVKPGVGHTQGEKIQQFFAVCKVEILVISAGERHSFCWCQSRLRVREALEGATTEIAAAVANHHSRGSNHSL